MAEPKKYYWLKLKEDFFNDDTIQWIEDQENRKEYCLFYLKLCLKSLRTDGILIRNVGNMLIPYDIKKLSEITNTEKDTVRVAMELFKGIGLVQVLESGGLYLSQLENMVGAETKWAEKKRKQRHVPKSEDNVLPESQNCPREKEKV
ncbi:MAG: phage replisome organizer N-terminal domain-containing protein [Clostridium sp.]|uniref:phage replisome organizer N-terminal domain-containing protein n=1 Tax=Clostridium sp. TaxID=1506 RepID=UPI0025C005C9|nr:phage replisome organizer N-terminal domain-containing protein [Clostridium sp.]MCE5221299.1 phage replisome organizer N-terminal domain-containing protein [Clostridium sp.]